MTYNRYTKLINVWDGIHKSALKLVRSRIVAVVAQWPQDTSETLNVGFSHLEACGVGNFPNNSLCTRFVARRTVSLKRMILASFSVSDYFRISKP